MAGRFPNSLKNKPQVVEIQTKANQKRKCQKPKIKRKY